MSRNDQHLAMKLRKLGKSYKQISRELNVPKSTLSNWLSNLAWSKSIKDNLSEKAKILSSKRFKLVAKVQKKRWFEWEKKLIHEAQQEFKILKHNRLFLAGLMLYWSEGDNKKGNGQVRLGNTDPRMVRLFVKFALQFCKVQKNKIHPGLIIYPDINEAKCKTFWSKYIGIPEQQFYKTQTITGKHPTKRLQNGICTVRIGSTALKNKVTTWINLSYQELARL